MDSLFFLKISLNILWGDNLQTHPDGPLALPPTSEAHTSLPLHCPRKPRPLSGVHLGAQSQPTEAAEDLQVSSCLRSNILMQPPRGQDDKDTDGYKKIPRQHTLVAVPTSHTLLFFMMSACLLSLNSNLAREKSPLGLILTLQDLCMEL